MTEELRGLHRDRLEPWLTANVAGAMSPYAWELVTAGGSNLTYRVTDGAGVVRILRRPPTGRALKSAHDMGREVRILTALGDEQTVPVPQVLASCEDPDVTGAGCYVMSFVDGTILRDRVGATALSANECATATEDLVATHVALHQVDLHCVGLADIAPHGSYVARQLRRWHRQVRAADVRHLPLLDQLHDRLERTVPLEQARPALVHGDYRFDNVVLGSDHRIAAVLDWELSTIGDPVADIVWSLQYWADPGDDLTWLPDAPTLHESFPRRSEVLDRYRRASGLDLSRFAWYEAFSWWKHACIVEGVYARRLRGSRGGSRSGPTEPIAARVEALLEHAWELTRALT